MSRRPASRQWPLTPRTDHELLALMRVLARAAMRRRLRPPGPERQNRPAEETNADRTKTGST